MSGGDDATHLKRTPSVWSVDLQEVQEVQVFHSLLLDQFDPRHDKRKNKTKINKKLLFFLNWFLLLIIDPTLTDDPLAPLGPGGPYTHKDNQEVNIHSDLVTTADAFTQ